jgi:hypothetical protein
LARAKRKIEELARQFQHSANVIRKRTRQEALDEGCASDGLTTNEREELNRLCCETGSCAKSARYQRPPGFGGIENETAKLRVAR